MEVNAETVLANDYGFSDNILYTYYVEQTIQEDTFKQKIHAYVITS